MTTVIARRAEDPGTLLIVCDFSPPRGADASMLEPAGRIGADFVSVAYHPGKSTTVNAAFAAHWIREHTGTEAMFTLATRDMNRLALQSLLLGGALVGVQNSVIVGGDPFSERELERVQPARDVVPSEFLRLAAQLNEGRDYRSRELVAAPELCVGATIDLGAGAREPALTRRKVEAGAQFFLMQPVYTSEPLFEFLERYEQAYGEPLSAPLFVGQQILTSEGIVFGDVPERVTADLERGRPGEEIAVETAASFLERGVRSIYLVPPILRGGTRDYATAGRVVEALRQLAT